MAHELEPAEGEERDHAADVEGISRGIEASVEDGGGRKLLRERGGVGAIGEKPAPLKFVENGHRAGKINSQ